MYSGAAESSSILEGSRVNVSSAAQYWSGQPVAHVVQPGDAPARRAQPASVVWLDNRRPRATEAIRSATVERLPDAMDDAAVARALDRPGVALAFAAQLLVQTGADAALAPPALAAAAYRSSVGYATGFLGRLDPVAIDA